MYVKSVLFFLMLFKWMFALFGVDTKQLSMIMEIKLKMDNRRAYAVTQMKSKKNGSYNFIFTLLLNIFVGFLFGLTILVIPSIKLSITIVMSAIMVLTAMTLISDFTSVLLDTTDNNILLPKPISSITLVAARITHIFVYLLLITFSFSMFSVVFSAVKYGFLFAVTLVMALFLMTLFVVFLANLFYMLLMKITSPEKFRDIVMYIQMAMIFLFFFGYQIIPRLTKGNTLQEFHLPSGLWTYFYPPVWYGSILESLHLSEFNLASINHGILAIVIPVIGIYIVVKFLAPGFDKRLFQMENHVKPEEITSALGKKSIIDFLSSILNRTHASRILFSTIWKLSSRDRGFKLKTYPGYAMAVGFPLIMAFTKYKSLDQALLSLPETKKYLIFLYFACLFLSTTLYQMSYSDDFEASWIYTALPVKNPGMVMFSGLKVMLVRATVVYCFTACLVFAIWKVPVLPHIFLAYLNMITISILSSLFINRDYPFSKDTTLLSESNIQTRVFLSMLPAVCLGLIHFGLTLIPYGTWAAIPIVALINGLLLRLYSTFNRSPLAA